MSLPMLFRWMLQRDRPPPPKVITEAAFSKLGIDSDLQPAPFREALWATAHLTFGVLLALPRTPHRPVIFGVGIWLVNYGFVGPALGVYPRLTDDHRARTLENVLSHVVYGIALRRF
jgi:hypothetical protein